MPEMVAVLAKGVPTHVAHSKGVFWLGEDSGLAARPGTVDHTRDGL